MIAMKKLRFNRKFLAFILLYIVFFSFSFTAVSYSKLSSTVEKEGYAGVARWQVEASNTSGTNIVVPRGNTESDLQFQTFVLTVTSYAEVGLDYSVVIKNVPSDVYITFDDVVTPYTPSAAGVITISGLSSFHFDASENTTHTHDIIFFAAANAAPVSNRALDLDVIFVQEVI